MMYKAAVFDLDDTLLRDDLSISSYTLSVFRALADQGFLLLPASGRSQLSMKPFVDRMPPVPLYISCNGAEIWDGSTHQVLHRETFSLETGLEINDFAKEYGAYAQAYEGDKFFFNLRGEYADRYARASMLSGVFVGDLASWMKGPQTKILMMADPPKIAAMMEDASRRFDGRLSVTSSKPHFLEFNPLRATKGNALSLAAGMLSLDLREIIAFGDSLNDLSMLTAAGLSVAVANGRPVVREACREVCLSNEEDGVARFLARRVLGKEEVP